MARDALGQAEHYEIINMASGIIKTQESEITQMQDWEGRWSQNKK
jgi:uncharacterized protein (DUF305 family)